MYGAETGTSIENAIETEFGTSYRDIWTSDWDHDDYYHKIEVPSTGILTIQTSKPVKSDGQYGRMHFVLYDVDEEEIWGNSTYYSVNDGTDSYVLQVGLNAGTYYA